MLAAWSDVAARGLRTARCPTRPRYTRPRSAAARPN